MKLPIVSELFEKYLEKSPIVLRTVTALHDLATEVHGIGVAIIALAQMVQAHHEALHELYARQGLVMKAVKSNSLDMNMPNIKSKEPAKPN
jgi:hypothetical protein